MLNDSAFDMKAKYNVEVVVMRIACLHTVESNVAVFDAARPSGVALSHTVRPDLLRAAEQAGGLTPEIQTRTAAALLELAAGADAVLLTCSTVGPGAAEAAARASVPILRVDAALAEAAVRDGGKVVVLCAVETTLGPSKALFEAAARGRAVTLDVRLVAGAWAEFKAGNVEAYNRIVADAADAAYAEGADVVALAQASMAGAARLASNGRPLASPDVGIAQAAAGGRAAAE